MHNNRTKQAYRVLGNDASFYDGMITCSTMIGKAICHAIWNMDKQDNDQYVQIAMQGIAKDFSGTLLEVPVGTGVLSLPFYKTLPHAEIHCLDYSEEMLARAQQRAHRMELEHVGFLQGDVGCLPFAAQSFDVVLSLNGFHAFPDPDAAWAEIFRVLKSGGIACGCFYIKGEVARTDFFVRHLYQKLGYFNGPFETKESLKLRLEAQYTEVSVATVQSIACFCCRKR